MRALALFLLLGGCTWMSAEGGCRAFPQPRTYTTAQQERALMELENMPVDAVVAIMIEELGAYRARWRAVCR